MRGDIYRLRGSKTAKGYEQKGTRYAVVLQSDYLPLSTALVAPTSTSCAPASFRPTIEINGIPTRVMVEQTAAVDVETRLAERVGHLTHTQMQELRRAVLAVFGIDE